jgi:7-carboxy-7-deazaguanine synthase
VDERVHIVMDLKAPGSGEVARNRWENIPHLRSKDQVKIVLADRADFDWAMAQISAHDLAKRCPVLFSPVHESLAPQTLAQWILDERAPVRFQMQLHKFLWGEERGR